MPRIAELPGRPDLSRGRCAIVPPGMRGWWTSRSPAEREAARQTCFACPVLAECRAWALALPVPYADTAVYGGMLPAERRKLRRAIRDKAG